MAIDVKFPELAEGVETVTVVRVLVSPGDLVAKDQPVLEVETDKAAAEVPSPVAGKVIEIRTKPGDRLAVGQVFLLVEAEAAPSLAPEPAEAAAHKTAPTPQPAPTPIQQEAVEATKPAQPVSVSMPSARPAPASRIGSSPAAAPSVRRLAREIGVDINDVAGTGPGGRITQDDVKAYARSVNVEAPGVAARTAAVATAAAATTPAPAPAGVPRADSSRFGNVERVPMSGVRRRTAENMTLAWTTIPHVTQHDDADITELERFRKQYAKRVEAAGGKLTVTAILVRLVAEALKRFPQFNASVDMANAEVIYKRYINIGVAVDTDRGLIVPVLRDADKKSVTEIAIEMGEMAERARARRTQLDELQGGTFTISNLGGIGGTAFTPIINPPEVAILGVSRSRVEPIYIDGQLQPHTMLPLSLSYDHRVIDGADGARFVRWLAEALEQPLMMFLES